jgi:hypothetical protein
MGEDRWDVNESRSVKSVWVWRGFLMMALVAAGVTILFASNHRTSFAVGWGIIAAGWFGISMFLWKKHTELDR